MSLTAVGTIVNVFGVVTFAKDVGEVTKIIADSIEEVKENRESSSYWDRTLQSHAKEIYSIVGRCKDEGATDFQTRSLWQLLQSLILLRKELVEVGQQSFLRQLHMSGEIKRNIKNVERRIKQCQDMFVTDTLSSHTTMLARMDRRVRELVDRDGRHHVVERTTTRWKVPGKADTSSPLVVTYANLAQKTHRLIDMVNTKAVLIQDLLLECERKFKSLGYRAGFFPVGDPEEECEDASENAVSLFRALRDETLNSTSFTKWLEELDDLRYSLNAVGMNKESRQIREFLCRIWLQLASRTVSTIIYSRLAVSLRGLAVDYLSERRDAEALPLIEKAIRIYRKLGESSLPNIADCLHLRSHCFLSLGRYKDSLKSAEESVGMLRRLADDDFSLYGCELVCALTKQADAYLSLSHYEDALQCCSEALQWLQKLSPQYRKVYPVDYAWTSWNIAKSYFNLGNPDMARVHGERALDVYYDLIHNRPLYYAHTMFIVLRYCFWVDREGALPVLDKSLTVCLTVDTAFTAPQSADILDRRADTLMSSERYSEALESYDQAIDIRHRLFSEDGENPGHFESLLSSLRNRTLCLLSLHRQHDAASSLSAAQDAITSRLKSKINMGVKDLILQELKKQCKMLETLVDQELTDQIISLKSCKKVLLAIDALRHASQNGGTVRSDLGILFTLECQIHCISGKLDMALLSAQDAIDFYSSSTVQKQDQSARIGLIGSLFLHAQCCAVLNRREQALNSIHSALRHFRADLDNADERKIDYLFKICDFYSNLYKCHCKTCLGYKELCSIQETAIEILRSPTIANYYRTRRTLIKLLVNESCLKYTLGLYQEALAAAKDAVEMYRILPARGNVRHEWNFACSLYLHAKSLVACRDADAALTSIGEAIDIQKRIEEREPSESASDNLSESLALQAEILYRLGRAAGVTDGLAKRKSSTSSKARSHGY